MSGISNITQGAISLAYGFGSLACSTYTLVKAHEVGNQALKSGIFKPQNEFYLFSTFSYLAAGSFLFVSAIFHLKKVRDCFNAFYEQKQLEYNYSSWDIAHYGLVPLAGLYLLLRRN